ncbi:hypothetical protein [Methylotenera sp. N17]|uniref:hypothetical protein n=1 Tax=Methylotenera sp. N17 TaxID=1502761 RepID=UPI00064696D2|nr:hypothetical protein [Methylotenera sp. N17]
MINDKTENRKDSSAYESAIRWQAYARESRTAANSHYLAYSAAILALQSTILVDDEVISIAWPISFALAGIFAFLSLIFGSAVVLVRLQDARLTARVARYRYTNKSQLQIKAMRKRADNCSGLVNKLFIWQVISFASAALLFVVWVVGSNICKLI